MCVIFFANLLKLFVCNHNLHVGWASQVERGARKAWGGRKQSWRRKERMEPISFSCWRSKVTCLMQLTEERKGSWGNSRRNWRRRKQSWGHWGKSFIWSMDFPWVLTKEKSTKSPIRAGPPIRGWSQAWGEDRLWCWVHNRVVCSASGSWVWKTRYGLFSVYIVWQIFLYSIYQFFPAELSSFDWPKNLTDLRFKYLSTDV